MSVRFKKFLAENEEAYLVVARLLGECMAKAIERERAFRDMVLAEVERKVREEFPDSGHEADIGAFLRRVRRAAAVPRGTNEEREDA